MANKGKVTADLAAVNAVAGPVSINGDDALSASVSGTFTATVQLQRSLDGGTTWDVLQSDTAVALYDYFPRVAMQVRAIMTAFTSGSAHVILSTAKQ